MSVVAGVSNPRADFYARNPGYNANHRRVYRVRGKASAYLCPCGQQAHHWSWNHDSNPADPANYTARCRKCHWKYDDVAEQIARKRRGRKANAQTVAKRAKTLQGNKRRDGKVPVPNIHIHKSDGRYRVQVRKVNGGLFTELAKAVNARNSLAIKVYGPDAKLYDTDGNVIRLNEGGQ